MHRGFIMSGEKRDVKNLKIDRHEIIAFSNPNGSCLRPRPLTSGGQSVAVLLEPRRKFVVEQRPKKALPNHYGETNFVFASETVVYGEITRPYIYRLANKVVYTNTSS